MFMRRTPLASFRSGETRTLWPFGLALMIGLALSPAQTIAAKRSHMQTSAFQACSERADTDVAMHACAQEEFARQDKALNTIYKTLMAKLNSDGKDSLILAERDWVAFRDDECRFQNIDEFNHTDWPILIDSCEAELTEQRIKDLKTDLDDVEYTAKFGDENK